MLVALVLETAKQLPGTGTPPLVALLLVLAVFAVATGFVRGACGTDQGS